MTSSTDPRFPGQLFEGDPGSPWDHVGPPDLGEDRFGEAGGRSPTGAARRRRVVDVYLPGDGPPGPARARRAGAPDA